MTGCIEIPAWALIIFGILILIPSTYRAHWTVSTNADITSKNFTLFLLSLLGIILSICLCFFGCIQYTNLLPCITVVP
jgi:hypothetical protein